MCVDEFSAQAHYSAFIIINKLSFPVSAVPCELSVRFLNVHTHYGTLRHTLPHITVFCITLHHLAPHRFNLLKPQSQ
jgi:hypothetical protein